MLISIIIPVYNTEAYITRCIQSCQNQVFNNFELIVVDDGSTDQSNLICSSIANNDPRIHLFTQKNTGASFARNHGLDVAKGHYVMFIDSDDWIDPYMIEEMVDLAKLHPEVQVIQTRVPGDLWHQTREGFYTGKEAVKCLLEGSWWGPCCKLIRNDIVDQLRFSEKTISEDYLFNYMLFSHIDSLYYIDKCFYHRTIRCDSLSRIALSKRKFDEFYNVKKVCDNVKVDYPEYLSLADFHLAGTCLKLLFFIFNNNGEITYHQELKDILRCIRSKYVAFLKNPHISKKERFLIFTCFSEYTARKTEWLYSHYKKWNQ